MKEIKYRTLQTPFGAHYIRESARNGSALTVDYFRANGEAISIVSASAGVISEETFNMMIGENEKMNKAPAEPKGKSEKDPRTGKQKQTADLPRGRNLTKGEKGPVGEKPKVTDYPDEEPKNPVKKQTPVLKGTVKGEGDLEETFDLEDEILDENTDRATYSWEMILEALTTLGLDQQEIARFQGILAGNHVTSDGIPTVKSESRGISFLDLKKTLAEAEVEQDIEAVEQETGSTASSVEGPERKNEVYPGMSKSDLDKRLQKISTDSAKKIEGLAPETQIRIVKMKDDKVRKVIPTTVISTKSSGGSVYATVSAPNDEEPDIKTVDRSQRVMLQRGRKTGVLYYIHDEDPAKENKIRANFVGTNRGKS